MEVAHTGIDGIADVVVERVRVAQWGVRVVLKVDHEDGIVAGTGVDKVAPVQFKQCGFSAAAHPGDDPHIVGVSHAEQVV